MKISNFIEFFIMFFLINNGKSDILLNLYRLKNHLLNPDSNNEGSKEFNVDHIFGKNPYFIRIDARNNRENRNEVYKSIARTNYGDRKKEQMKKDIVMRQHKLRKSVVEDFMKKNMMTTKYFYDEVQRIKRTRQVKDDLRMMVEYLERPGNELKKEAVLNFFRKQADIKKVLNVWDQPHNDLVINIIKDPFNYGTIN